MLSIHLKTVLVFTFCIVTARAHLGLISEVIKEYFRTGVAPHSLKDCLISNTIRYFFRDDMSNTHFDSKTCDLCELIIDLIIYQRRHNTSREVLISEFEYLCINLDIENERVCKGAINQNADIFLYIIDNKPDLDASRVCGTMLQSAGCQHEHNVDWSIEIPKGVSPDRPQSFNSTESLKILHISDIHYDPLYTPNGNAECGEPICCQNDQGKPDSSSNACGYWTDYRNADTSWHLIEEILAQIKNYEFDYVYYTGDIMSHRIWETSVDHNSKSISKIYSYFKDHFDVPVFPVLGNHEPHPLNQWPSENIKDDKFSLKWLFELVAKPWSDLVGEDISETVLNGGFYTVSPRPGFRVIVINSNFCYTYNWWLIFNDVDPYGQLQCLADTLLKAEKNKESVHILSHVPTGTVESFSVWGREFSRIVERFASTITGMFVGHTHTDEIYVYYSRSETAEPIGVAFNGAALTPWVKSNPSYKIFEVDSTTFEWTFNLTLANLENSKPEWYKLYSFVDAFGVENLSPVEVDKVLYKMTENHNLLDDNFKFKYRNGDLRIKEGCDDNCKKQNLCQIATTVFEEKKNCNRFTKLYEKRN